MQTDLTFLAWDPETILQVDTFHNVDLRKSSQRKDRLTKYDEWEGTDKDH